MVDISGFFDGVRPRELHSRIASSSIEAGDCCHTKKLDHSPIWVEDVNQDGWKDILAPGKEGLYLFQNRSFQDLN
jgi:hypothetical protein